MIASISFSPFFCSDSVNGASMAQFSAPADYNVGQGPYNVVAADINHDGKLDLVAANYLDGSLSVLLGNGDGTFLPATNYQVSGGTFPGPFIVVIGDFNNDTQQDLVTGSIGTNTVEFYAGNGDGTFAAPVDFDIAGGAYGLATGDFNADGRPDIVAAAFSADQLSILMGSSNLVFVASTNLPTGNGPASVAVGDFNGDGKLDLVNVNYYDDSISVFLGNGDGTFGARTDYDVFGGGIVSRPVYVATGDFNGDGKIDLVVVESADACVLVLIGKGDGTFFPGVKYPVGAYPSWVAVADLNGDGIPELVVANAGDFSVSILPGVGEGTFQPEYRIPLEYFGYPFSVATGDLDNDGCPDLVLASYWLNAASVLLNTSLPEILIQHTNTAINLTWPDWSGFRLESSTNFLSSDDWKLVSNMPSTNGNQMNLTLPISQNSQYFRLHKQ